MPKKWYSLDNKIYPLSSLESEMERLFGTPVWYEEKVKLSRGTWESVFKDEEERCKYKN